MQQDINIKVGDKSPETYFKQVLEQCQGGIKFYGGIDNIADLHKNLEMNCIPVSVFDMSIMDYDKFLLERRQLMAKKIKEYYLSL
jgi:hypothetical protein